MDREITKHQTVDKEEMQHDLVVAEEMERFPLAGQLLEP